MHNAATERTGGFPSDDDDRQATRYATAMRGQWRCAALEGSVIQQDRTGADRPYGRRRHVFDCFDGVAFALRSQFGKRYWLMDIKSTRRSFEDYAYPDYRFAWEIDLGIH
jgi:hypothetical protein